MTPQLTRAEIFNVIREIIADELDLALPKIDSEVLLCDICDCLEIDLPIIIIECEREFGVAITDDELEVLETIEELVDLVEEKILEIKLEI